MGCFPSEAIRKMAAGRPAGPASLSVNEGRRHSDCLCCSAHLVSDLINLVVRPEDKLIDGRLVCSLVVPSRRVASVQARPKRHHQVGTSAVEQVKQSIVRLPTEWRHLVRFPCVIESTRIYMRST